MTTTQIRGRAIRLLLAGVAVGALAAADEPRPSPSPEHKAEPGPPRDRSEWFDMLADILRGSQLGPGEGWFRTAVTQTRFTWEATRAARDLDGDGLVSQAESGAAEGDFTRLDRDGDGLLSAGDFDFSAHALAPSPGAQLFRRLDRDGDGKVAREEFDGLFKALDGGGLGFLSQDELRGLFAPPAPPARAAGASEPSAGPTRWTLVKGLFRQEIGSLQPGPNLDEPAPDFRLRTADGKEEVALSSLVGPRPVVLVFGNFTCGPFRSQAGNVEKLYRRYKDRANFAMVYVREAHPTDGWSMESNERAGVSIGQPRSYAERVEVARTCGRALRLGLPMLVDSIDDAVGARYSGMPARLYLIDRAGKVAYKGGRGPFGFKPAELEQSLILLLDPPAEPRAPDTPRN